MIFRKYLQLCKMYLGMLKHFNISVDKLKGYNKVTRHVQPSLTSLEIWNGFWTV